MYSFDLHISVYNSTYFDVFMISIANFCILFLDISANIIHKMDMVCIFQHLLCLFCRYLQISGAELLQLKCCTCLHIFVSSCCIFVHIVSIKIYVGCIFVHYWLLFQTFCVIGPVPLKDGWFVWQQSSLCHGQPVLVPSVCQGRASQWSQLDQELR